MEIDQPTYEQLEEFENMLRKAHEYTCSDEEWQEYLANLCIEKTEIDEEL